MSEELYVEIEIPEQESLDVSTELQEEEELFIKAVVLGLIPESAVDAKIQTHNQSQEAHTDIRELIASEAVSRQSADNSLQTNIDQLSEDVAKAIEEEIEDRRQADSSLGVLINTEKTNRQNADNSLAQSIREETERAGTAETNLNTAIEAEESERIEADNNLQTQINQKPSSSDVSGAISAHNISNLSHNDIRQTAEEALARASEKSVSKVFETISEMESWLRNEAHKGELSVGDNLYITDKTVPDYWISAVYTTPDAETGFYYRINELTPEQPDISNMMTTDTAQTVSGNKNFTGELQNGGKDVATEDFVENKGYQTETQVNTSISAHNQSDEAHSDIRGDIQALDNKIEEVKLFKFPNAIIIGSPTINNGQVSGFSNANYLILPFLFDVGDRAFELNFHFMTGSNITTAQNLIGSSYCLASYISNGKLYVRASGNGTSWNILDIETSLNVQPNSVYFIRIAFNRLNYTISASTDGETYTQIGYKVTTEKPIAGQLFIGVGNGLNNPFLGIINLNKWYLKLNNSIIWEGMDDAGLATRADISLSNLDGAGEKRFDDKQDVISDLNAIRSGASLGATAVQPATLSGYVPTSRTVNGKALSTNITFGTDDIEAGNYGVSLTYFIDTFVNANNSFGDCMGGSFDYEGTFAKASYQTASGWNLNNISDRYTIVEAIGWCDRSIGKISTLTTTVKTDLVSAVNEVNSLASSAVQPNDNISKLTNNVGYITADDVEANVKDITQSTRIINIDLSDTTQFSKEAQTYGWIYNSTYGLCPENSKTIRGTGAGNSFAYCKWSFNYDTPVKITIEFTQDSQQAYDYLALGCYDYEVSKAYSVGTYQYRTYNKSGNFSVELYVPAGEHYLTWKYIKNSSTDTGLDMCYIRSIKVEKLVPIKFKNVDTNEERVIDLLRQPLYATYNVTPYITINTALKNNIPVYFIYSGRIYQAVSYPTATSATTSIYCTSAYCSSSTTATIYYISIANTNTYASGSFSALPSTRIVNNMTASTTNAPSVTTVTDYVADQINLAINQAMEDSY